MDVVSDKGLSKRILLLFVFTTCVLIAQGIYNIYSLSGVNRSIAKVYDSVNHVSGTWSNISLPISELRQLSMSLVMAPNTALRQKLKIQISELKNKTQLSLTDDNSLSSADPKAKLLFEDIEQAWDNYSAAVNVTVDYANAGVRIAEFINVTIYERNAYEKVTVAIVAYNAHQLKISAETFQEAQNDALIAFWAVLITTVVEVVILKLILAYVLNLVRQYLASRKQNAAELKSKNAALEKTDQLKLSLKQRVAADEKLSHLRNYLANIIDSMPSVLIGVDRDLMITQWNHAAQTATGFTAEQVKGQPLLQVLPRLSTQAQRIAEVITLHQQQSSSKQPYSHEGGLQYEDITIYPLDNNGVDEAMIRIDNVTEQVRMQELMVQSEKMLSVGGLAAGMAHEINNPLAGVMQTSEVMKNRLTSLEMPANIRAAQAAGIDMPALNQFMESRGIKRMLDDIKISGQRVADIVENMLSFARKSEAVFSPCALNDLLDKALNLAVTDYDLKKHHDFKSITVVKQYAADLPMAPCEEVKIQQVLLNILRNGAQEMQNSGIENASFILRTYCDADENRVCIEIEDNGKGMSENTRKRVFEPFFTTKPVGEGTGLGLSVSYFIISENHGGELSVESAPDNGTTFIIRLPLTREAGVT